MCGVGCGAQVGAEWKLEGPRALWIVVWKRFFNVGIQVPCFCLMIILLDLMLESDNWVQFQPWSFLSYRSCSVVSIGRNQDEKGTRNRGLSTKY
jgi:hypothetical protein